MWYLRQHRFVEANMLEHSAFPKVIFSDLKKL